MLREAYLAFDLEKVDLATKQTESGADYLAVNPKGYVPALRLGNGEVLAESPAVVQHLADLAPEKTSPRPTARWHATACRNGSTSFPPNCTRLTARAWATPPNSWKEKPI